MSFKLNSIITIGQYRFRGVNEVVIKKSMHSPTNTCNIKVPTSSRLTINGKIETESIIESRTATRFNEGDAVKVELGYNGRYDLHFIGFVRRINFNTPLEIECEGYSYQLRKPMTPKTFVNVDYTIIIKYIIQGTDIVLSDAMNMVRSIPVAKFVIETETGIQALERLNKTLKGVLAIVFHGKELYMGIDNLLNKGTVKYQLGWNVIKDDQLKLRDPGNMKVSIETTVIRKDGTKEKVKIGDNTTNIKKDKSIAIQDIESIKYLNEQRLKKEKYTGYEGVISAFGSPFCQHAYQVELTDLRYKERNGTYLVDSVSIIYNMSGFRIKPGIGVKL